MKTKSNLYRGENYGVFTGPNGYYVGAMAKDGASHYQPANGGNGWGDGVLAQCNRSAEAQDLDIEDVEE